MNKKLIISALSLVFMAGCVTGTTSSMNIKKGSQKELEKIKTVTLESFESNGEPLATTAIRNSIIDSFLPSGITIVREGEADAVIEGTIFFTRDSVSSSSSGGWLGSVTGGGTSNTSGGAMSGSLSSEGAYVSGITAQIIKNGEIVASTTATQSRVKGVIPSPPEVLGKKVGKQLVEIITSPRSVIYQQMSSDF